MCLLSLCVFYQPIFISLTNLYFWALYGFFFSCHDKVQSENNKLHEQYKKNKEKNYFLYMFKMNLCAVVKDLVVFFSFL